MADAKTARLRAEVMSEIGRHRQYAFEQPAPFRMPRDMMDAMESALDAYVARAALVAQSECDCENPRTTWYEDDENRARACHGGPSVRRVRPEPPSLPRWR